jgi:iron complex outermembrane receptor protein
VISNSIVSRSLRGGAALRALTLCGAGASAALFATPAFAQDTPAPPVAAAPQADESAPTGDIVVTGTLFRRADTETPSPVTVLSSADLARRGITTVTDAIQSLSANNGSNLPTAFSANGAFAAGASAVSLRGLTTDSTLVLFDGLRAADYPLADDGVRSFVDLNTIPQSIVDRVEVLRDGASSTYGADAVAGVVNVIVKKQITGIEGIVEGGISQRGDAGHQRLSLTAGYGDLQSQGFNVYINGEYQRDDMLMNSDRGFPYNTNDLSRLMADDGQTPDANTNSGATGIDIHANTDAAVVQPARLAQAGNIWTGQAISGGAPSVILAGNCGTGLIQHSDSSGAWCEQNNAGRYGVLQPQQTRFGVTGRGTVKIGDTIEAYLMGTYYQNEVFFTGAPNGTRASQPTTARFLTLPALLRDGSVNPYDPYANIIDPVSGQRESALLNYQFSDIPSSTKVLSTTYRIAGGLTGSFGGGWNFALDATYMKSKVKQTQLGLLDYAGLEDAIETGAYNFADPSANSQAVRDQISHPLVGSSSSQLWQVQGTVTKDLLQLPGGALKLGVGGQIRYEEINNPVQDPINPNGTYSPYQFLNVNLFTAAGHRYNESASFELDAPIVKELDVNVSGRYDHYSEGFSHFSPKVGVKFSPIPQLALRGTFSKGFRAPSIPETSGQVIGFVNTTPPADVAAAHGNDAYVQQYALGEFNTGNPNLKPETSTSFTGGAIVQPARWLSFTVDYYHIKKNNVIVEGPNASDAIAAYYASGGTNLTPIPGYTITQNPADPNFPNAIRTVDIVSASFVNAASLVTSGLDMSATFTKRLGSDVKLTSTIEATRVFELNLTTDGSVQKFAGTEGPYINTSDSGTPKWRGNWSTTLEVGKFALTGTAYYTSGYNGYAPDYAEPANCDNAIGVASDGATAEQCHVKSFIDVDLTGQVKVTDKFTFYMNVLNLFDAKAPFDPNTYGGTNYNPAFAQAGVLGRMFRAGANFKF